MKCLRCDEESLSQENCSSCGASLKDQIGELITELNKKTGNKKSLIKNLGTTRDLRVVKPIIKIALDDEDLDCRIEAIKALGQLKDKDVVVPLMNLLQKDSAWEIRAEAANAIGKLKGHKALETLEKALNDSIPEVKVAAVKALGRLGSGEAIKLIARMLTGQDPRVERTAMESLQKLGYQIVWDGTEVKEVRLKTGPKGNRFFPLIGVLLLIVAGLFLLKSIKPGKEYAKEIEILISDCEACSDELLLLNKELEEFGDDAKKMEQIGIKSGSTEAKFRGIRGRFSSLKPPVEYVSIHKELEKILGIYVDLSRGLVSANTLIDLHGTVKDNFKTIEDCRVRLSNLKLEISKLKKSGE